MLTRCLSILEFRPLRLYTDTQGCRLQIVTNITLHRIPDAWSPIMPPPLLACWWLDLSWPGHPPVPGQHAANGIYQLSATLTSPQWPDNFSFHCSLRRPGLANLLNRETCAARADSIQSWELMLILLTAACPLQSCPCPVLALGPHVKLCKM